MSKAKVVVVGPRQSGKTVLCNFLADATESSGGDYHPTQGVRIVEFETNSLDSGRSSLDVELWDCSGDKKFEACWPAMIRDATGAIFVYNPDQPNHDKELDSWLQVIQSLSGLKTRQCLCVALKKWDSGRRIKSRPSNNFSRIPLIHTNLEEDQDSVRREFNKFLSSLVKTITSNREQEELNIMNQ